MTNRDIYNTDPAYAIQTRLSEYFELLCNLDDYYEYALLEIEDELSSAISLYFDSQADEYNELVENVHSGIEYGDLDLNQIEEQISVISSAVRRIREQRDSWSRLYKDSGDEDYRAPSLNLGDVLRTQESIRSLFNDVETAEDRERAEEIRTKAARIYRYISTCVKPVSKDMVASVVSAYSDRALALAVSRKDILNYRGLYFCTKHIDFSDEEQRCFRTYISSKLSARHAAHIDDLYEDIAEHFAEVFTRAYIQTPYHLFSFIECYFSREFNLARPYIAFRGVHIASPQELLTTYVRRSNELPVSEFVTYAKEKHIKVNSILELIVSLNDTVLLKNRETIVKVEATGITPRIAQTIVRTIADEVVSKRCMAIRDLTCLPSLPSVAVPWDEWLLYSVIRKWGTRLLMVHTTSAQFRQSVPVVALPGAVTEERVAEIAKRCSDLSYTPSSQIINNLDDLDDLILGYIDLDVDLDLNFDIGDGDDE